MTATCFDDDHFWLITGAGAFWHDRDWLNAHCPDDGSVTITDLTREMGSLLITGPTSPAIMEAVTDESMAQDQFKWLTHRAGKVAGVDLHLIRVSFSGEAGWELHVPMAKMEAVYDALMAEGAAHNLKPFGMLALDSMRLEKGYRSWKSDLTSDYTMLESGLSDG